MPILFTAKDFEQAANYEEFKLSLIDLILNFEEKDISEYTYYLKIQIRQWTDSSDSSEN